MTSQQSLTVATAFVTAEKFHRTVTMTANTLMQQQLLTTTVTVFATSFKIIVVRLCHRQVKQTKSTMERSTQAIKNTEVVCNNLTS